MRARVILLLSLGLNFALGAMLFYALRPPPPSPPVRSVARSRAEKVSTNGTVRILPLYRKQFFSWSEIESPDYPTYIANLRSIDCPEPTIRDIIVADVDQLYAQKRAANTASTAQQWWRSIPDLDLVQTNLEKLQALDVERRALLTKLLGPGWESAPEAGVPATGVIDLGGPVLGSLSPETKQSVQDISTRSQQRQDQYAEAQRLAGKPVDPAELARIRRQTREELAKVLNPEQLEEFLLRYSSTANSLRNDLLGFQATPDEFRQLFRIRDPMEQQIDRDFPGNDPSSLRRRQELKDQEELAIRQALGPERYRAYQLAQDPVYREAQAAAEKFGAPAEKVLPVYQVNQLTLAEQQRIRHDPTLSPEERERALQLVNREKEKSIREILQGKMPAPPVTEDTRPPPLPDGSGPPQP